jgi:glucosyl-3-phosphoglycerate synthase
VRTDVRRWFDRRTYAANDWSPEQLIDRKGSTTVSVVLPALNEEATVGPIVAEIAGLAERTGLVDDLVVVDSGSTDRTSERAAAAGARVLHRDEILPHLGSVPGKGEVLWKALYATAGDLVVYIDADLTTFGAHYVTGLLGPLLNEPSISLVKGFYDRPLAGVSPAGGGRATELMARPLLNLYFPELAGVVQPLAGEYAARRSLLERLSFVPGYGVEIGLLIDSLRLEGLDALAQVDLGDRSHDHQDTQALGRMAATILHTVASRLHPDAIASQQLVQFARVDGEIVGVSFDIPSTERPPMVRVPGYARRPAVLA